MRFSALLYKIAQYCVTCPFSGNGQLCAAGHPMFVRWLEAKRLPEHMIDDANACAILYAID